MTWASTCIAVVEQGWITTLLYTHFLKDLIYNHACMQLELQLLDMAQHGAIYDDVCAQQRAHFCVNTLVRIAEGRLGCGAMRGRRIPWARRVEG